MSCDFVPDECSALAIQACLLAQQCGLLEQIDFKGMQETFGAGQGLAVGARLEMNRHLTCLKNILEQAFIEYGCPFPGIPDPPDPPDLADCQTAMNSIQQQIQDPLSRFSGSMTITLDADMKPTRITVP